MSLRDGHPSTRYIGYNRFTIAYSCGTQQGTISVVDSYRMGALVDMGDHFGYLVAAQEEAGLNTTPSSA